MIIPLQVRLFEVIGDRAFKLGLPAERAMTLLNIIPGYVPLDAFAAAMFSSGVAPWPSISINDIIVRRPRK
jgi:hypothetical protein